MSAVNAWSIALEVTIAASLLFLLEAAKDLVRTLKRIEARMTLHNPLKDEQKPLVIKFCHHAETSSSGGMEYERAALKLGSRRSGNHHSHRCLAASQGECPRYHRDARADGTHANKGEGKNHD